VSDVVLRGVTWDHPRGILPLEAVSRRFSETHPGVSIEWRARSLAEYEDQPIEDLFHNNDLVAVNHPFIGDCATKGLLLRLDDTLPSSFLGEQLNGSMGPSYESYQAQGKQYALPLDAASIVSAYRPDVLKRVGGEAPRSFLEVLQLHKDLQTNGLPPLAVPLVEQHAYSAFLSLFANLAGAGGWDADGLEEEPACHALESLATLSKTVAPECFDSNPIQLLDAMASGEISYIPYTYGYVNYVRPAPDSFRVAFADMPGLDGGPRGSLLGGVGIGISSATSHQRLAKEFLTSVTSPETQRTLYVDGHGQAAHRAAWTDPDVQSDWPGFYETTMRSLESAFLRPRPAGFPTYQKRARLVVHRFLKYGDETPADVVRQINEDSRTAFATEAQ
jgi:multiple sugar transport system substrate-binding protein